MQQIAQPEALRAAEIGLALEHAPSGLVQDRLVAVLRQPPSLGGAHIVEGVVHLGDYVEAVEDKKFPQQAAGYWW